MKSFTQLRNSYGDFTKNTAAANLTFGDEQINDTHREICSMRDWWWLHKLRMLTTLDPSTTFTAVVATDVCTGGDTLKTDTGTRVRVSSATTLPGGLSANTDYYMIYQSTTTFQLATSLANALAGTAINITDTGTGTHTVTVQTSSLVLPYDMDHVESVHVIVSGTRYTPKLIHSREDWDLLNLSVYSSNIPIYAFVYNGQLEFWPQASDDGNLVFINGKVRVIDLNVADYTTGTVDIITNGNISVTGSSTVWTAPMVGRWIRVTHSNTAASAGAGHWYEIAARVSDTSINLTRPYGGRSLTTGAAGAYIVGMMPLLPENFHALPVYRAAATYWDKEGNFNKATKFENRYNTQLDLLKNYTDETSDLVLDEGGDEELINPNLTLNL